MNVMEITEIIASLKELSGVGVCFYDLENFFQYNDGGVKENVGHYCELCKCVRLLPNGRKLCDRSDRMDAVMMASEYRDLFFAKCHIGLCELVVPILAGKKLCGVMFLGQCRIENEDATDAIGASAEALGGDRAAFVKLYQSLPMINRKNLVAMGKILQLYFRHLTMVNDVFPHADRAHGLAKPLAERVANYIDMHYMRELSAKKLSETFYLNQSYLARAFKDRYDCTLTQYIRRVRMDNAKRLLQNSNIPINNIALNVGFADANYFSRLFLQMESVTPSVYRQQRRCSSECSRGIRHENSPE